MKNKFKVALIVISALFVITACGSDADDAKKVEVKKETQVVSPQVTPKLVATKPVATDSNNQNNVDKSTPKKDAVASKYIEGKHYVEIFPPMQTDASQGKVEVIELMWLGCPHCYNLEPTMLKYKKNHPDFVEFKQVPAMLNPTWSADARTFYLADILDPTGEKELVTQIFQAIHEQKRRLRSPDAVKRLFIQFGFTEEQIDNALNSMAFKAKLDRAREIGQSSQAQSVPTLIINGKYRTSPYIAGSEENLMEILDMLTKKEHQAPK